MSPFDFIIFIFIFLYVIIYRLVFIEPINLFFSKRLKDLLSL